MDIVSPRVTKNELFLLSSVDCSLEEAAAWYMLEAHQLQAIINKDPELERAWCMGQHRFIAMLKRQSWKAAQINGSAGVTMLIHLRKHKLGEFDRVVNLTPDQIDALILDLERQKRIESPNPDTDGGDGGEHRALAPPPVPAEGSPRQD